MRPLGRAWRKDGRRAARRAQEHVLDERRERATPVRVRPHSQHILNDTITPALAWLIERFPDEDAGPEYLIVKVTPLIGWLSFPEAAHGTTVRRAAVEDKDGYSVLNVEEPGNETVMDLISQAREALNGQQLTDGRVLRQSDLTYGERGWAWEDASQHCWPWQATPRHQFDGP